MISLAFGIDESEFGAEALLLARAVITDWRIAKVIRLSQPPRGELLLPIEIRGEMSVTGLDKCDHGSRVDSTWSWN